MPSLKPLFFAALPRCSAHIRSRPCVYIAPNHHKPRPDIGRKAAKHIRLAYTETKKFLPSFNFLQKFQKKSQRREVALLILEALFQFTDYLSLEVGKFLGLGDIEAMPCRPILKDRRIGLDNNFSLWREINRGREPAQTITYGRMLRALKDLKIAGYIEIRTRALVNRWGKTRALVAIKKLTPKVFKELGISMRELQKERARKMKNLFKEEERAKNALKVSEMHAFVLSEKENDERLSLLELAAKAKREVGHEGGIFNALQRLHPDLSAQAIARLAIKFNLRKKPPDI